MTEHVGIGLDGGVLEIVFARPEKKNAITQAMYTAVAEALERAQTDPAVRAILFLGEGETFSAGNDVTDFMAFAAGGKPAGELPVFRVLKALAHLDKPAVAGVRGQAIGIGTTLLLHCDLVFVAEDAKLSAPFVNLALVPEAASSLLLPAAIGHQRAFAMFALGEAVSGADAALWGLANRALPAAEVDAAARAAAAALAARPAGSLRLTKRLMRDAAKIWALMQEEGAHFDERLTSPEAREAFTAFFERRPPDFSKLA
jgi:enoyl-CoA hydratase/carnithine racemase